MFVLPFSSLSSWLFPPHAIVYVYVRVYALMCTRARDRHGRRDVFAKFFGSGEAPGAGRFKPSTIGY